MNIEKIIQISNLNDSSKVIFIPKEEEINKLINEIKIFGNIKYNDFPS